MIGLTTTPNIVPAELEMITGADRRQTLQLYPDSGLLFLGEDHEARLDETETKLFHFLISNPHEPFKLAAMRRVLGSKTARPIETIRSTLKKAPFLSGHPIAVIENATQIYGLTNEVGNTEQFESLLDEQIKHEFLREELIILPDGTEEYIWTGPRDYIRRHNRILKVASMALTGVAATSAILGYRHRGNHK